MESKWRYEMKKKIILISMMLVLIIGMTACGIESSDDGEPTPVRYAVMTGPTGVGSVNMIEESKNNDSDFAIEEKIVGTPDEIVSALVSGNLDMAVVPANLASVLYKKTEGKIQTLATNNLGVLYIVEVGTEINSLQDLKGKTILSAGKGATPETVFNYIMTQNKLIQGTDWNFEFKAEATEVAQNLISGNGSIALLPEPMVSTVLSKNKNARIAIKLDDEWSKLNKTPQITSVLVGRKEFLDTIDVEDFLDEYKESIEEATSNIDKTAELVGKYKIMDANVAKKAIPNMNLKYIDNEELKDSLTKYLEILKSANPKSIGGSVPGEDFYYLDK